MLTSKESLEVRELVDRIVRGSVDADDWASLAALTLIAQGEETCAAIVTAGFDTFVDISRPIFTGHAFSHNDFRRIYDRICAHAQAVN